ncbi:hypothetical protein D3C76_566610 [compost metagenome]
MQTTGNLGLKKPEGTDIVDIADLNGNMDILDNAVTGKVDKVTGKQLSTNDYTAAEKTKLAGIATGATNYTHPATHPPAIIAQDASNRFVTDTEKTAWNAKAGTAVATTSTNGLMSAVDKTLLNNNTGFGTTAGAATAYTLTLSPAPTALIAGLKFSFKTHIASGANPTLNPNTLGAKAIKKPNGSAAILALNGVYTVVYDGTAFILQGEGGEYGTATAADVLAGKTIGTDNGLVTGTIPVRANDQVATIARFERVGRISAGFNKGAYITDSGYGAGVASVAIEDANIDQANWLRGKPMFGQDGTIFNRTAAGGSSGQYDAHNAVIGKLSADSGLNYVYLAPTPDTQKTAYDPGTWVRFPLPNLVPENYLQGKPMLGQDGAIVPRVNYQTVNSAAWGGTNLFVRIPLGAYITKSAVDASAHEIIVSPTQMRQADGNLTEGNIRNGATIFGVPGSLQPMQSASGMLYGPGSITITGLSFTPKVFTFNVDYNNPGGWTNIGGYWVDPAITVGFTIQAGNSGGGGFSINVTPTPGGITVTNSYGQITAQQYNWMAWG